MKFSEFSPKQLKLFNWWCRGSPVNERDAIICDGAVRSGKTMCMSLSFVYWALRAYKNGNFAICGKTVTALRRNVITPLCASLCQMGFCVTVMQSKNYMEVSYKKDSARFYFFGGKDESSAALIQGITLCGVMFDEVALMPRSFVEQALARCSAEGSKYWFNCNPEHPSHWFYQEWIKKRKQKNALYLHFTMADNPSLSGAVRQRYESLYAGAFYERFILGRWTAPLGLVYPMFGDQNTALPPAPCDKYYVSADYGTVNPASFGLWGRCGETWYRIDEYYYSSKQMGAQLTDEEYCDALDRLCGGRKIEAVVCDPSAASFMTLIRKRSKYTVLPAVNGVSDGVRQVSTALKSGAIKIAPHCKDTLREFSLYRWEDSARCDCPKKENDHAMDDIRYFVSTVLCDADDAFFAMALERG